MVVGHETSGGPGRQASGSDDALPVLRVRYGTIEGALAYLDGRWADRLANARLRARKHMRRYYVARWTSLVGAALLPSFVTIATQSSGQVGVVADWVAIAASVVVALSTAFLQVTKVGVRWSDGESSDASGTR